MGLARARAAAFSAAQAAALAAKNIAPGGREGVEGAADGEDEEIIAAPAVAPPTEADGGTRAMPSSLSSSIQSIGGKETAGASLDWEEDTEDVEEEEHADAEKEEARTGNEEKDAEEGKTNCECLPGEIAEESCRSEEMLLLGRRDRPDMADADDEGDEEEVEIAAAASGKREVGEAEEVETRDDEEGEEKTAF